MRFSLSWWKAYNVIARHTIVHSVVACLLLILLASCATASPSSQEPPAPTSASNDGESVTLLLWHGWSGTESQVLGRLVERFNRQHPNGRVILQQVPLATLGGDFQTAVEAGSGPHITLMPGTWIGSLVEKRVLLALDDLISPTEQQALLSVTLNGARAYGEDATKRLYGVPIDFDTLALYYNGANVLRPPETTAELIDSAHGLGAPTANPPLWGLALNLSLDNTLGYLYAYGGRVFDDDGKLVLGGAGRASAEQWLGWLLKLNDDQGLLTHPDSGIQVDRELKNGQVFMTFDWAHQIAIYRNLWGSQLGIAPLPRLSETNQPPRPYVKSNVLAINGRVGPAERRAALEFLHFMIGEEAQRELLTSDIQPARRALGLDGDSAQLAAARAFRSQAEQGQPMPNSPNRTIVEQELKLMQRQVLMGFLSPADAVADADRRLRERLDLPPP